MEHETTSADIIASVFYVIICVIGIVGNVINVIMILVLKEHKRSSLHSYVIQLAIADTLFLFTIPFMIDQTLRQQWQFPVWMCTMKEMILFINYNASILFLMVMSIDRYIAVCHSFSTKLSKLRRPKAVMIIILVAWLMAFLGSIPAMMYATTAGTKPNCQCQFSFPSNEVTPEIEKICRDGGMGDVSYEDCLNLLTDDSTNPATSCVEKSNFTGFDYDEYDFDNESYTNFLSYAESDGTGISYDCAYFDSTTAWKAFIYSNFVFLYILPFLVMSVTYGLIIRKLSHASLVDNKTSVKKSLSSFTSNADAKNKEKQNRSHKNLKKRVSLMCASLVITFAVCWLPYHILHIAKLNFIKIPESQGHICRNLRRFATAMAFVSSAMNPYLYNFIGTKFRSRWKKARKHLTGSGNRALSGSGPKTKFEKISLSSTRKNLNTTQLLSKTNVNSKNLSDEAL